MRYASVTSITHSRQCCNYLISWRLSKWPTVRLVACCLCLVKKVQLQSISQLASQLASPVLVTLVGETGQSARVITRKGTETLTIVCRVEVTDTIVCVKWRCECQDRQLFALVLCWGALQYCTYWNIIFTGLRRTMEYKFRQPISTQHLQATTGMFTFFVLLCVCNFSFVYFSCVRWILCITYVAFNFFYARRPARWELLPFW